MRRRLVFLVAFAAVTSAAPARASGVAGDGGPATAAELSAPGDVATLPDGALLIADTGHGQIRLVAPDGIITSVAGGGSATSGPVPGVDIRLLRPTGLAVDAAGGFLIADAGADRVWRIDASGVASVLAGTGQRGFGGDGEPATAARLANPTGVAVAPDGAALIADQGNDRVRRVSREGTITTVAGGGSADSAIAVLTRLSQPSGVSALPNGSILVADTGNHRIVLIAFGVVTVVAGTGVPGATSDSGRATTTPLGTPIDVAATAGGGFVIADQDTQQVRRVSASGTVSTAAGTGELGRTHAGEPADETDLAWPGGVTTSASGALLVANSGAGTVVERAPDGTAHVVAGKPKAVGAAPQTKAPGYRVWLNISRAVGAGCSVRLSYTASHDGSGTLKAGGSRWTDTLRMPGGAFRAIKIRRAGTYTVTLTARRRGDAETTSDSTKLVVKKLRCG